MLFAVFDGHGPQGGKVSRYCTNNIAQVVSLSRAYRHIFTPRCIDACIQTYMHTATHDQLLEKLSFTPEKAPAVFTSAFLRLQRMLHNAPFDAGGSVDR